MNKFEKKYVHFMWSDELEGRKVFRADSIGWLMEYANKGDTTALSIVSYTGYDEFPFLVNDKDWKFVYYDPNYEAKVAHEQGKKIECKRKGSAWGDLDWDYTPSPEWLDDHEYRIQSEAKPVTYRELAMWLAKGNGQRNSYGDNFSCDYAYRNEQDDEPISSKIKVRKWNDSEWHEPTREYLGL